MQLLRGLTQRVQTLWGVSLILALAGCSGSTASNHGRSDGGSPDAAITDAASTDATADSVAIDAFATDGASEDAALADGATPFDAAVTDSGGTDGAVVGDAAVSDVPPDGPVPITIDIACTDTPSNVYVTPGGLPLMTLDQRGDIVRCTIDPAMTQAQVMTALSGEGDTGVTATNGVDVYRVAYRTYRNSIASGMSSARIYLPHGLTGPRPMVVVGHASEGMAASCATSMNPGNLLDIGLPWAAMGYPVIAPDYAGLGTEGTQGYLDNGDESRSLLDGARALRQFLPNGAVNDQIILAGHSQGGGVVLSAQSLVRGYGAGGNVVAAVVFAPEWPSRLDSFQLVNSLSQPTTLTIQWGITTPVVVSTMAYAYFENHVGVGTGSMAFPAAQQATVTASLTNLCLTPYGAAFQGLALHVSDWLDPTLRTTFLACVADPTGTGCTGTGQGFYNFVSANSGLAAGGDPLGAPILYVQGMQDIIMSPSQEAACNMDRLTANSVDVTLCTDALALHTNVVQRNIAYAMGWVDALLGGTTVPPCTGPALPTCQP